MCSEISKPIQMYLQGIRSAQESGFILARIYDEEEINK